MAEEQHQLRADVRTSRKRMLALLGGGATLALAGASSAEAAGTATVTITNVLNNLSVVVTPKRACAVDVCNAIQAANTIIVGEQLTCTIS